MKQVLSLMVLSIFLTAGNCVQAQFTSYENPSENYLNISGTLDEDLEYMVRVMYVKNARESGCPTYGKDSDLCQIKPEEFTYIPEITEQTHSLHIPLKELSPDTNSWWEPHDISICVGPRNPNTVPHQCQVLFSVTKTKHDGNQNLDLVCSKNYWCYQGRQVEHVSLLNREYVVNIRKETKTHGPTTTIMLDHLIKKGKWDEYVDRVHADLERWKSLTLLIAAKIAMREKRLEDGALLYHAGTIRAQVERKHYTPTEKGGDSPTPAIQSLMRMIQMQLGSLTAHELTVVYEATVPKLEEWNPYYSQNYDPGWKFEGEPSLQHVQTQFNETKAKRVRVLRELLTLFRDETYAGAHSIVQAYEWDPSLDQQAEEKYQAEKTMLRLESQLGIVGYMTALTQQRELMENTTCFELSADGENTACQTHQKRQ